MITSTVIWAYVYMQGCSRARAIQIGALALVCASGRRRDILFKDTDVNIKFSRRL
jgi:hypothetical protein